MGFFIKTQTALGVDISPGSLKLLELQKKGSIFSIKAFADAPLPKGLLVGDAISDKATFDHLLKAALDHPQYGKFGSHFVVANIPETKSFVRVIQIPTMSEVEAEAAVPFEAENFIPMPIDQVYLDWQKLSDSGDKMNILIIATPKEFADQYLSVLEKSGLRPVALEAESQSCHRALIDTTKKETSLIVDLAESRTSLIMVEEGNMQFTSTIPFAGSTFTESIARTLGVSSAKAEMIKLKIGLENTVEYPNIKTSLLPILNNLTAEIKNILKFHSEHSDKEVVKIILTGGTAKLKNLPQFLAEGFTDMPGLEFVLGDPLQRLGLGDSSPLDAFASLNYTTAIGLAMRGAGFQ